MFAPDAGEDLAQLDTLRAAFLAAHAAGDRRLAGEIMDATAALLDALLRRAPPCPRGTGARPPRQDAPDPHPPPR